MPVLINSQTGNAEDLSQDSADQAISSGTHEIPLVDPHGQPVSANLKDASSLLSNGYTQPSSQQLQSLLDYSKYSSAPEQIKTGLEGAAEGATFGLSTGVERALGVDPNDMRARAEINPLAHGVGKVAGLVGSSLIPGIGEANILHNVGEGAASAIGLGGEGAGFFGNAAASATRLGVESALMQAGDENTKFLQDDPNQTAESAIADVGLSGVLGAGGGLALGAVSPLWKAASESKATQFASDFASRVKQNLGASDPVDAVVKELSDKYNQITSAADEVYGANGLKHQDIQKLLPENMTDAMTNQAQEVWNKMGSISKEMAYNPDEYPSHLSKQFSRQQQEFQDIVSDPNSSPTDVFEAMDRVKQFANEMGKGYVKQIEPEYGFVSKMRSLAPDIRSGLEDSDVWGNAATRQKEINSAFREFNPALKDFEKKFTSSQAGEKIIDPGKVSTYLNQLGKPSAEIKQSMLQDFMDAATRYEKVINDTHANLGIESPLQPVSMPKTEATLEKISPGAHVADALMKSGISRMVGGGVGEMAGAAMGHPIIGWIGGEHFLGPIIKSVIPAIAKPLMEKLPSAEGLKGAMDFSLSAIKGNNAVGKAARAVFRSGMDVLPSSAIPSEASRDKLKKKIDSIQTDTAQLMNVGGHVGHYMPDHGAAIAESASRAVQYLSSLKPSEKNLGPLDPKRTPSATETSKYERALDIADQPIVAIKSIKDGTLTPDDVITFKTIYPSLYRGVSQKLTNEMIGHVSKSNPVPYKTRLSLSLFLGQPLDSTMTPQAILSTQGMSGSPMTSQQSQGPSHGRGSMKNINKLSSMYQTGFQSAASRRMARQ